MILLTQIFLIATVSVLSFAFGYFCAYWIRRLEIRRIHDAVEDYKCEMELVKDNRNEYWKRMHKAEARVVELEAAK